ncbi:MAG: hypothetical protein ACK56F_02170 [bacterium]
MVWCNKVLLLWDELDTDSPWVFQSERLNPDVLCADSQTQPRPDA